MREGCEAVTQEGHTCPAAWIGIALMNLRALTKNCRKFGHIFPQVAERVCALPNFWQVYLFFLRESVTISGQCSHFTYGKTEANAT